MRTTTHAHTSKAPAARKAIARSPVKAHVGVKRSATASRVVEQRGNVKVAEPSNRAELIKEIWDLIIVHTDLGMDRVDAELMKGEFKKHGHGYTLSSPLAHKLINRGISPRTISPLSNVLGVGMGAVTSYLDIDRGTPARQESKGQPLPRHAAEGVLRLLEIEHMAFDTFEEDDSREWLHRPHPLLDGETPLQAAGTSYGAERVKSILVAIKYGGAA